MFALVALGLRRRRAGLLSAVMMAVVLASPGRSEAAPERLRLFWPGLTAGEGVSTKSASAVSDFIQSRLMESGQYDIVSAADLGAALTMAKQSALLGCGEEDPSCMSELSNAYNTQRLLKGSLTRMGESLLLTLAVIDTRQGRALAQRTQRLRGGDSADALLDSVEPTLAALLAGDSVAVCAPVQPAAPPPLHDGVVVGLRGDADLVRPGVAPGLSVRWGRGHLGLAGAVIVAPVVGVRGEARGRLVQSVASPYAGVGLTLFGAMVSPRVSVGVEVPLARVVLAADVAAEYPLTVPESQRIPSVLASVGIGFQL